MRLTLLLILTIAPLRAQIAAPFFFGPAVVSGIIAVIQSVTSASSGATAVTTEQTGTFTQVAGHELVVPVAWFGAMSGDTVTCTDTAGDTWATVAPILNVTGGTGIGSAFCVSFSIAAYTGNQVTVTSNGGARSYLTLAPVEISGGVAVDATGTSSSAGSSGTSASSSVTTTVANDIIFTQLGNDAATSGFAVTGYTQFQAGTQTKAFYDIVTNASSYTQSWSWTSAARSAINTVAIHP